MPDFKAPKGVVRRRMAGAVWHVGDCFAGGVATHVRQLVALLPELDHRIVSLGDNHDDALLGRAPDLVLPFRRSRPHAWRAAAREVARLVPRDAVLHGHSTLGGWVGAMAARRAGCRLVYTPHAHFRMRHGKSAENAVLAPFERALFRGLAGTVVACGTAERDLMVRQLPRQRTVLIPHAIKPEPRLPLSGRPAAACFLGRLEAQKRPALAADLLVRSGVAATMVGRGGLQPAVERILAGQDRVRLAPRVGDARDLMRSSRVLVLTSSYEVGVPYVVLEAWACGTDVLATPAPGVDEALATGAATALPPDPEAAAALIRDFVEGRRSSPVDPRTLPFLDEARMAAAYRALYGGP